MFSRDVPFISEMFILPPLPFFSYFSLLYFLFSLYHTTHHLVVDCKDAANPTDESELAFRSRETSLPGLLIPGTASYQNNISTSISSKNLMHFIPSNGGFSTLTNTRSVMSKIDEITNLINANHVGIACVTGIDGCTCERRDRVDRRGGSVLISIRNGIQYHRINTLECDDVESLWLLVSDKYMPRDFSHILISAVYHPRVPVILPPPTTL